ncbi:Trafficking protein particle complex subunit 6B [Echinococcus granulosus]|uniref:Trafficking protein particle complex subunit 6B n=1 Tax=Echinococcus granulosus TaxID=6210 RepID=W6U9W1_ECHGR|nr:Trafficking protein particle complex subunit 6B [Echinococcus granulosus]EUB58163.1 Trafficking protein particle complex subunit 6B [Echinococcus granulosus]KAH9284337.1 Trafficking protein particle complex subunit 6B [Echinococcus granulosus]
MEEHCDGVRQSFEFLFYEIIKYFTNQTKHLSDGHTTAIHLIENMGYRIGQRSIERLTKNSPRFTSEIEIVKFICRGYWSHLFQKDISTLKTNNADVYVLIDSDFPYLTRIEPSQLYNPSVEMILAFACGLLRGGLSSLGVSCIVNAEIPRIPTCHFTVRVSPRSKTS